MNAKSKSASSIITATNAAVSEEFHNLLADIEDFIKSSTSLSSHDLAHAKAAINARIHAAKKSAEEMGIAVADRARDTVKATDSYVHENPWQAIGIGAGIGAALGLLVGVAISRR